MVLPTGEPKSLAIRESTDASSLRLERVFGLRVGLGVASLALDKRVVDVRHPEDQGLRLLARERICLERQGIRKLRVTNRRSIRVDIGILLLPVNRTWGVKVLRKRWCLVEIKEGVSKEIRHRVASGSEIRGMTNKGWDDRWDLGKAVVARWTLGKGWDDRWALGKGGDGRQVLSKCLVARRALRKILVAEQVLTEALAAMRAMSEILVARLALDKAMNARWALSKGRDGR